MLLLKTAPGLEDILAEESRNILGCRVVETRPGRVFCENEKPGRTENLFHHLRTVHSVHRVLVVAPVSRKREGLAQIAWYVRLVDWCRIVPWASSFAVRGERIGEGHEYSSTEISATVGEAIHKWLGEKNMPHQVSLEAPTVSVTASVVEDVFILSIRLFSEESLHRRWYRVFSHRAALKPSIAAAMIYLSGFREDKLLLDPMCGGGTIPIEAALMYENARMICSDSSYASISAARFNAIAARVETRINFIVSPVDELSRRINERADVIVTNPPYGLRIGNPTKALKALRDLFKSSPFLLKRNGVLTLITPEKSKTVDLARNAGLVLEHERHILHGRLRAWILVFRRGG